ncbi:hypothetical protein [Mycolicibacterium sp. lyk4-40-TYG-92]|uniref:hypothetical protein n=1 Tax=Mycolicibacterium sp. lyk4-40-TYG-92 TaxID=3040295 RepID=UPI00254B460A|nr:hypothetical protein [Mycolicibacterium sp. lyk4-40-TYG-92]
MADAQSLQTDISGVTANGMPEPWRAVHNGQTYQGTFDAFEQQVTVAEQIAWVRTFSDGITRDSGDVLIELMEFAIQWRKANGLPTTAK